MKYKKTFGIVSSVNPSLSVMFSQDAFIKTNLFIYNLLLGGNLAI